jgi:hypothetical protein
MMATAAAATAKPAAKQRKASDNRLDLGSGGLISKVGSIDLDVALPLGGDHVLRRDRVDRAGFDAGVAVDALGRVDVKLFMQVEVGVVRGRMDAVDRADLDARCVLGADAGLIDDVGDGNPSGGGDFFTLSMGKLPCTPRFQSLDV